LLAIFGLALAVGAAGAGPIPARPAPELAFDRCAGPCWISLGKRGGGTGLVTSQPAGMDCGTTCQWGFTHGTWATLVATPDGGASFTRWEGGGCKPAEASTCTTFMDDGKSITAVFDPAGGPVTPEPPPTEPPPPAPPAGPAPPEGSCTITGTAGSDELRGTGARDVICGLGGGDHIHGGGGDDIIRGGGGPDEIEGEAGRDRIEGGPGADVLEGGLGADELVGGLGRDLVLGAAGPDTLHLRDGARDVARGGPGVDRARADRSDALSSTERRF